MSKEKLTNKSNELKFSDFKTIKEDKWSDFDNVPPVPFIDDREGPISDDGRFNFGKVPNAPFMDDREGPISDDG